MIIYSLVLPFQDQITFEKEVYFSNLSFFQQREPKVRFFKKPLTKEDIVNADTESVRKDLSGHGQT